MYPGIAVERHAVLPYLTYQGFHFVVLPAGGKGFELVEIQLFPAIVHMALQLPGHRLDIVVPGIAGIV